MEGGSGYITRLMHGLLKEGSCPGTGKSLWQCPWKRVVRRTISGAEIVVVKGCGCAAGGVVTGDYSIADTACET